MGRRSQREQEIWEGDLRGLLSWQPHMCGAQRGTGCVDKGVWSRRGSPRSSSPFPGGPQPSASSLGRGSSPPASSLLVLVVLGSLLRCCYSTGRIRGVSKVHRDCGWQLSGSCQTAFDLPSQEKHPLEARSGKLLSLQAVSLAITFSCFSVSSQKQTCHCQIISSSRRKILHWFWMRSHHF